MIKRPEKITDYKNDVYFKYLLANDQDPQCLYMLKVIIESLMDIKCQDIKVLNPNINPQNVKDKDMVLDVRVKTETGEIFDIEMQNSKFSTYNRNRFQSYGASNIVVQTQRGDERYGNIHQSHQFIFINDVDKDNLKLIDTYKSRNEEGKVEKNNLISRTYIQIPMIDVIVKQKGIEGLTALEAVIYVFKNGMDSDIMRLKNQEVIKIMKEKMDKFNEDVELRLAAYNRQLNVMAHVGEKQEAFENGKRLGKAEGKEIGRQEGKLEKIKEKVKKYFHQIYPNENDEFLNNLNQNQYDEILDMLFDKKSIDEIQLFIKR